MTKSEQTLDLGKGNINKLMLKFSIPCILSLLISSLYNIVDQIFIGNSKLSTLGNAATGVVFPIFIIAQAFAWCLGDGCASYLNICQGQNKPENAHVAVGGSITISFLCGLFMLAVIYPFKEPILTLFGASSNTMDYAIEYLDIVLAMMPIFILCNMMNSTIRADGSPLWAMIAMLAGAVVNIILDPLFIFTFDMGMTGAALATIIGQGVTFILTVGYFFKTKTFKLKIESFTPKSNIIKTVIQMGASTFVTQLAIVIVAILCNVQLAKYGLLSKYGSDIPIAVIAIESKIFTVVINLVVGIVLGCQPIISFNMGAKKYKRVKELYGKIMALSLAIGIVFTLIFELAPNFVIGLFGEPTTIDNPEAYWEFGRKTLRIFLSLITISCLIKMNSIFFQASGKASRAVVSSLIRDVVCFVPLVILLPKFIPNVETILYVAPISDLIAMVVTAVMSISFVSSLKSTDSEEEIQADNEQTVLKTSKKGVIITIAREHGSSGKQIGEIVAKKLGIPFYYKEMMAIAAQESGLHKEFIEDINNNSPAILHGLYLSTTVVQHAVFAQEKVINAIADKGSCVLVGRAADYVLKDREDLCRVFVYAPFDYRVSRIMEVYGDSYSEAVKNVKKSDSARAKYYENISGLTWGDKQNYDIIVNSSIGLEECANAICNHVLSMQKSK